MSEGELWELKKWGEVQEMKEVAERWEEREDRDKYSVRVKLISCEIELAKLKVFFMKPY